MFEADSRHWQSGAIRSRLGDPGDIPLLPFLRVRVQAVEMDLGVLEQSGSTYMRFAAGGATCDDLRLAYSKIMTEYEVVTEDTFREADEVRADPKLFAQQRLLETSSSDTVWVQSSSGLATTRSQAAESLATVDRSDAASQGTSEPQVLEQSSFKRRSFGDQSKGQGRCAV